MKRTHLYCIWSSMKRSVATTVVFHADRVTAWKRDTGEWPVE